MSTVSNERQKTKMKELPLNMIRENDESLRKVDKKTVEYAEFVDSIKTHGVLNPITVREFRDNEGKLLYGLVDGLHRYTGAQDAGLDVIPCHILNMKEGDVLTAQIIANVQRIETKPVEYSKQLERILLQNPMWTMVDLAARVNKSPQWLGQRLKLVNLPSNVAELVNDQKIVLSNAYALVDLNGVAPDEVGNFLDRAQTMPPQEFAANISARVKEIKAARKQGREDTKKEEFVAAPFLQKNKAIKDEYENPTLMGAILASVNAKTPEDGYKVAIAWCVHMDPISQEEGKKNFEAMKAAQLEEREKKKKEREEEKRKTAAANTVNATEAKEPGPSPDAFVNNLSQS